ncbi:hypothetical protein AAG570_011929 [Ranatra chinensis]|uniref:MADF domain-containing protein n=1 Tax=Ranatra chinensis TaxID=642074 RepID=A0ABD0Z3L3_9HEMI
MMKDIDMHTFFSLIEERPVLWDKTLSTFKDTEATKQAWKEVCVGLDEAFEDLKDDEQFTFAKEVVKKWKSIRKSHANFCKKEMERSQSGARNSKLRKYMYGGALNFLQKLYKPIPVEEDSDMEVDNNEAQDEQNRGDGLSSSEAGTSKGQESTRKRHQKADDKQLKKLKISLAGIRNRHLQFFESVLPYLEEMEEREIVKFQLGVLQLLTLQTEERRTGQLSSYYSWGSVVPSRPAAQPSSWNMAPPPGSFAEIINHYSDI